MINAIKCLTCGTIIESKSVHDFVVCVCPHELMQPEGTWVHVDGGLEYQKMGWANDAKWLRLSGEYVDNSSIG